MTGKYKMEGGIKDVQADVQPNTNTDGFKRERQKDCMHWNTVGFKSSNLEPNTESTDHFPQVTVADFELMTNPSEPGSS